MNKKYYSLNEIAQALGISRIAVYKKVRLGQIKAIKIGRAYAVSQDQVSSILGNALSPDQREMIDKGVQKTIADYGETLRMLGNN